MTRRLLHSVALCALVFLSSVAGWAQTNEQSRVVVRETDTINAAGSADIAWHVEMKPAKLYTTLRTVYPNLYGLFRELTNDRVGVQMERDSFTVTPDDQHDAIACSVKLLGEAVCRNGHWEMPLPAGEELVGIEGTAVFTTSISDGPDDATLMSITCYRLPEGATKVNYDQDQEMVTYQLAAPAATGDTQVEATVLPKPSLMSALYKLYLDSSALDGTEWAAKAVISNDGTAPIYDVHLTYQLGDITKESPARDYDMIAPGGAVVDLYYPDIDKSVTQTRTRTVTQLTVKYQYRDITGKTISREKATNLDLLGLNQFQFSDLPADDMTTWEDHFSNAPLLAAFVTSADDPVKQFAGFISEASGGAGASASDDDARTWLGAAYAMLWANGVIYQTPGDLLTDKQGEMQEIKFPRDVLRDKAGTCVDLAILYAALARSQGLHAEVLLMPGHAFPIIELPDSGDPLAVEATGLAGGDQSMTFAEAVETGHKEMVDALNKGECEVLDIADLQGDGRVPVPELGPVPPTVLADWGLVRLAELPAARRDLFKRCAAVSGAAGGGGAAAGGGGPNAGDKRTNTADGAEVVFIPGGTFQMGSADGVGDDDEHAQHDVTLDGFWMYTNDVTVAQYKKFCAATVRDMPAAPPWGWEDDQPIVNVTWDDAKAYADWAGVRLPTEAEWEYAAHGGTTTTYVWGEAWPPPTGAGNFCDEACKRSGNYPDWTFLTGYDDGFVNTAPVGSFAANGYGLFDMTGNVYNWCADWYSDSFDATAVTNPTGPDTGTDRVLRGSSWTSFDPFAIRVNYRTPYAPGNRDDDDGFRCVADQ